MTKALLALHVTAATDVLLLAALSAATTSAAASASVDMTIGTATLDRAHIRRLAMCTGTFNLLWAAVTVLMMCAPAPPPECGRRP
jgi:hypothetical protein